MPDIKPVSRTLLGHQGGMMTKSIKLILSAILDTLKEIGERQVKQREETYAQIEKLRRELLDSNQQDFEDLSEVIRLAHDHGPATTPKPVVAVAAEPALDYPDEHWGLREIHTERADEHYQVIHPRNPNSPYHQHWLSVMEARTLLRRVYQKLRGDGEGRRKGVRKASIIHAINQTKVWKQRRPIDHSILWNTRHVALRWSDGKPQLYLGKTMAATLIAACREILGETDAQTSQGS